jgi:hypothetical protein
MFYSLRLGAIMSHIASPLKSAGDSAGSHHGSNAEGFISSTRLDSRISTSVKSRAIVSADVVTESSRRGLI